MMKIRNAITEFKPIQWALLLALAWTALVATSHAQTDADAIQAPDWAQPGSATHKHVAPPADFHRATHNFAVPIGIFEGQSDVGAALVPSSASFDPATNQYTINSAGYNIWYTRDEFRFLWKKMSGDISLAADASFPIAAPPHDRKIVLVIRQDLDDDSKEIMVGEHGTGMVHLAERPLKDTDITDMQYRIGGGLIPDGMPQRIGIEKHGDSFALYISVRGEPMHQFGPPIVLAFHEPFYVGIGFCSHYPTTVETGVLSNVVLENAAGKMN